MEINDVVLNDYEIELDRALKNVYRVKLSYSHVYIDYDDTVVQEGKLNLSIITFLYQCINKGIKIILLSKHDGGSDDFNCELEKRKIHAIFDEVIHIPKHEQKYKYINRDGSIFIDDSYGERKAVKDTLNIPVFDTHMIECLLEE